MSEDKSLVMFRIMYEGDPASVQDRLVGLAARHGVGLSSKYGWLATQAKSYPGVSNIEVMGDRAAVSMFKAALLKETWVTGLLGEMGLAVDEDFKPWSKSAPVSELEF
jgi:hypothetical protein